MESSRSERSAEESKGAELRRPVPTYGWILPDSLAAKGICLRIGHWLRAALPGPRKKFRKSSIDIV
jgi:hypothetical protein